MSPVPRREVLTRLPVRDRIAYRSCEDSHQIDNREQPYPNNVERMPEQRKAEQTPFHGRVKALDCDLGHHHRQPDQPGDDMQPVTADEREEGGEESATLRAGSDGDHAGELSQL